MAGTQDQNHQPQEPPYAPPQSEAPVHQQPPHPSEKEEEAKKWGTHVMGPPAVPTVHPDNQRAAQWKAGENQQQLYYLDQQPYVIYTPVERNSNSPFESVAQMFNTWSRKAETIGRNMWHNLKTGSSVSEAAWGKINLTAKAITEGGFESMFKQMFETQPNEKLKKTFACYLSTSTGPVAGTLYLSDVRVGFCSDRPLSFIAPSGQEAWSYYKVMIPLSHISTINPVNLRENPTERYIQIVTVDSHDFWFMGFVNYEKASHYLLETLSAVRAAESGRPLAPALPS